MGFEPAIEGKKQDDSQGQYRHDDDGGIHGRPGQIALVVGVCLDERHRPQDCRYHHQVRDVDKGQTPDEESGGRQLDRVVSQPSKSQSFFGMEYVEAQSQAQDHERQAHHVGVQVAQDEAEHRELGDRVVQALAAGQRVHHPCGPEPPPYAVGEGPGARTRPTKALDAHPLPEPAAGPPPQVHELHGPFQVSGQEYQSGGRSAEDDSGLEATSR